LRGFAGGVDEVDLGILRARVVQSESELEVGTAKRDEEDGFLGG
jgi:hypothetical protein